MIDKTEWLKKYVSGDDLPKAIEDFDTAFSIAASNFENEGWFVDDCVNFIYDHLAEYVEEFTDETIKDEIIKNAIDIVFVENVVDAIDTGILDDDDQDLKLTKSQKDFMGGSYHDEYDPEEYDDEDELLDDNF